MRSFIFLLLCMLFSCAQSNKHSSTYVQVSKVIDGDTFWATYPDGTKGKVRFIGIDAPETRKTGRKDVGYYGQESKEYLRKLLLNKEVRLEYDVKPKDKYQRSLAYVYLHDSIFVNELLVQTGHAVSVAYPPNLKHQQVLDKAQQQAMTKRLGLWGRENCEDE